MSIQLQPLLHHPLVVCNPISPREFWPAHPITALKISQLLESERLRDKIPIFFKSDLSKKNPLFGIRAKLHTLQYPVAIFFDEEKMKVSLAYRIKSIREPKYCCFQPSVRSNIEMISIDEYEGQYPGQQTLMITPEITAFGPASAPPSQRTSSLRTLLNGETCKIAAGVFSRYRSSVVQLDIVESG